MRILVNENIPHRLVEALRDSGHDVAWDVALMPGADDAAVLRRAAGEARTCLTLDKDVGEPAARTPDAAVHGIILLRLPVRTPAVAERVADPIQSRDDWSGHMSVIEPTRLRIRRIGATPFPGSEPP